MIYIKILDGEGVLQSVEAIDTPIYAAKQRNGVIACHCPAHRAQGVLSVDNSEIYQLSDRDGLGGDYLTAIIITKAEYDELAGQHEHTPEGPDTEDESPEIPEGESEGDILTRAQLTKKVTELEDQNAMLMECLLEISEAVYA